MIKLDPRARVACEVACTTGLVVVMGEISISEGYVDIPGLVRNTLKNIGYTDPSYGFDYQSCGVMVAIDEQSSDMRAINTIINSPITKIATTIASPLE